MWYWCEMYVRCRVRMSLYHIVLFKLLIYLSIYRSIYLSIYLSMYLSIQSHTDFQSLLIFLFKIANVGWPHKLGNRNTSFESPLFWRIHHLRLQIAPRFHPHTIDGTNASEPVVMIHPSFFQHIFLLYLFPTHIFTLPFFTHPNDLDTHCVYSYHVNVTTVKTAGHSMRHLFFFFWMQNIVKVSI